MTITTYEETIGLPQTARQPRALYLLVAVQMWECFSFYGMRALLVLYMVSQLQFSDMRAFGIYAVYSGLVELGSVVGGIVADRILGLRRAIFLGGWLIAAGHITMAFELFGGGIFAGLALIVIGSSLFSTNISALLGLYYKQDDVRREEGYTLFYMSINIGALLASVVCGAVGETYGWHYGFGMAAIGMIIGNFALMAFKPVLEGKGMPPVRATKGRSRWLLPALLLVAVYGVSIAIAHGSIVLPALPLISVLCIGYIAWKLIAAGTVPISKLIMLAVYLAALAVFYAAEEQIGSTLLVLGERYTSTNILGYEAPSSMLLGLNPATIILVGPFISRMCRCFKVEGNGFPWRLVVAFAVGAGAFAAISTACMLPNSAGEVSLLTLVFAVIAISGAELLVGPAVYSYCSEIAPEESQGAVMGLVPMGFAMASFCGGCLSAMMAAPEGAEVTSLPLFSMGYGVIACILAGSAVLLAIGMPLLQRKTVYK